MNKKVLVMAVALFAVAMLTASVNTALAEKVYTDHQYAGGNSVVDVPGQTMIRLVVSRQEGDYYSGKADRIQINVHTGTFNPTTGLPNFKAVSAYEDNPTRNAFSVGLGTGQLQNLVKPWQIQIVRICKTSIVYWTIPLVVPATGAPNPTPEVTLPPGFLILKGYGETKISTSLAGPIGTTGWTYSIEARYNSAEATLICPSWHYYGPVAEAYAGTTLEPRSVWDSTWTWMHP